MPVVEMATVRAAALGSVPVRVGAGKAVSARAVESTVVSWAVAATADVLRAVVTLADQP